MTNPLLGEANIATMTGSGVSTPLSGYLKVTDSAGREHYVHRQNWNTMKQCHLATDVYTLMGVNDLLKVSWDETCVWYMFKGTFDNLDNLRRLDGQEGGLNIYAEPYKGGQDSRHVILESAETGDVVGSTEWLFDTTHNWNGEDFINMFVKRFDERTLKVTNVKSSTGLSDCDTPYIKGQHDQERSSPTADYIRKNLTLTTGTSFYMYALGTTVASRNMPLMESDSIHGLRGDGTLTYDPSTRTYHSSKNNLVYVDETASTKTPYDCSQDEIYRALMSGRYGIMGGASSGWQYIQYAKQRIATTLNGPFPPGKRMEMLLKYSDGGFQVLAQRELESGLDGVPQDIDIRCKGNNIRVSRNGKIIFNVDDNQMLTGHRIAFGGSTGYDDKNNTIMKKYAEMIYKAAHSTDAEVADNYSYLGGYSVDSCIDYDMQGREQVPTIGYSEFQLLDGDIDSIEDVLSSHKWREGYDRYVVTVQDKSYPGLDALTETEDQESAQAAILESGANYIGLFGSQAGKGSSEAWFNSISNSVQNRGLAATTYQDSTELYDAEKTIDFITSLYNNKVSKTWLLVGTPMVWDKHYSDYEGDPQLQESGYPPGTIETERWRFTHNKLVFANSHPYTNNLGDYANSGKWIPASPESFNQTGTYSVNFKIKDNPLGTYNASNPLNGYMYFSNNYDSVG